MKKLSGIIASIIILLLLCSGIFTDIVKFFAWLACLDYMSPDVSLAGSIIIRILTFVVSYALVGFIFNLIGWFDSGVMKVVYFIISTLLSFALSYIVMCIETYWIIILIVLSVLSVLLIGLFLYVKISERRKQHE